MRLGVYSDLVYSADERGLSTHQAFVPFVTSLPPRVAEVVLFGRLDPTPGRSEYALPKERVRFVPLPHYRRVTDVAAQVRALRETAAAFSRESPRLDAVWIFGPHPMAVALALVARRHGVPLALGVRQDYPRYIAGRLPSRRWAWALPLAHALELAFRALARRAPTVAVGEELASRYRRSGGPVLAAGFSLVSAADVVELEEALEKTWRPEIRLLTVGRLDPEKNPLLLPEILAELRAGGSRWRLDVAGDGRLRPALERLVAELGLEDAVRLLGTIPNGPPLWALYRRSDAFLHVSLTEGVPQVLFEAQAAGLPIVATAVGGVPTALRNGVDALLVPPADAPAAARALERLAADAQLRARLVASGLAAVSEATMEKQLDRIAAFLVAELPRDGANGDRGSSLARRVLTGICSVRGRSGGLPRWSLHWSVPRPGAGSGETRGIDV